MKKANQSMSKTFDIKLGEAIDEHLDLSVCDLSNFTDVTMDLSKVKMINSVGVKTLLSFFKNHADKHVILRNCTVPFIQQYNIFPGMLNPAQVSIESFAIPYFCDECNLAKEFFIMTKDFKEVEPKACDDCGRSMDFDDIEEAYFLFLKPLKKAN